MTYYKQFRKRSIEDSHTQTSKLWMNLAYKRNKRSIYQQKYTYTYMYKWRLLLVPLNTILQKSILSTIWRFSSSETRKTCPTLHQNPLKYKKKRSCPRWTQKLQPVIKTVQIPILIRENKLGPFCKHLNKICKND